MCKNKILVLTTIYPSPDLEQVNTTNVVHYFAREWVKMGYDVRVVFNYPIYFRVFHWIAKAQKNILASKFNTSVTVTYTNTDKIFELENVKIYRLPLFKFLPHGRVSNNVLDKQVEKIHKYLQDETFVPDVIVAHNFYPHIPMVNALHDRFYEFSRTAIIVHKQRLQMLDRIVNRNEQIDKINCWGYRSMPLKKQFEKATGVHDNYFMCYSGIPSEFLNDDVVRDFDKPISRFVYVGSFIRRKHVDKIIDALSQLNYPWHLDIVGDGITRKKLENQVSRIGKQNCVKFHGFLPREQVPAILKDTECFIMISEEETFGLVYLEAMSLGNLTIASKGEGMDGIIEDEVNGFLSKAGNANALFKTIGRINRLSRIEKNNISERAKETSKQLTDKTAAKFYAESIMF